MKYWFFFLAYAALFWLVVVNWGPLAAATAACMALVAGYWAESVERDKHVSEESGRIEPEQPWPRC